MAGMLQYVPKVERRAVVLSVVIGILLLLLKFLAYFLTGSAAIFSDAMESIVNVLASGIAFYALGLAHRPPDPEHPYGHGKAEFLSAAFEGGMILLAGVAILIKAADAIWHRQGPQQLGLGLLIVAFAMFANGLVGLYLIHVGRKQKSMTLEADGKHLLSDAVTSVTALVALGLVRLTGWTLADPIGAILMALYIGWMGSSLLRRSSAGLMDKQDIEDERKLADILESHIGLTGKEPRICSYHKLRHRHSGRYHWVDFHIRVPAATDVEQGHQIATAIEEEMEETLGEGNATAHVEPCSMPECLICRRQASGQG